MFKKLVGLTLAISLILTLMLPINAMENYDSGDTLLEMKDEKGIVTIKYQEDLNGNKVFTQYLNGTITQKNVIRPSSPNVISRTEYVSDNLTKSLERRSTINIDDYIKTQASTSLSVIPFASSTTLGTINYQAVITTGVKKYGLKVSYTETNNGATTYTIKSYLGTLVDLVSLVVGAINLPTSLTTTFLKRLLISAGITLVGGALSSALSTTVSCNKTTYNMMLVDTTDSGHYKNVYGYKYYVTDIKYHTGETYYEGYLPRDWKTQVLGVKLHNEMFWYTSFNIVSWS